MSLTFVAGTQAEKRTDNKIYIFNVTGLHRTEYDSDSEKDDEDLDNLDDDAIVKARIIKTSSEVNRIKVRRKKFFFLTFLYLKSRCHKKVQLLHLGWQKEKLYFMIFHHI